MATKNIEELIKNLEKIVEMLEENKLPVEEAMKKFEEGVEISKECTSLLDSMEKKMTLLLQKNDKLEEKEFDLPKK